WGGGSARRRDRAAQPDRRCCNPRLVARACAPPTARSRGHPHAASPARSVRHRTPDRISCEPESLEREHPPNRLGAGLHCALGARSAPCLRRRGALIVWLCRSPHTASPLTSTTAWARRGCSTRTTVWRS